MPLDDNLLASLRERGQERANDILKIRDSALQRRAAALQKLVTSSETQSTLEWGDSAAVAPKMIRSAGVLVAEGDSWFDYPFNDVLKILDTEYGYDIESVAHRGDPIEEMAYGGSQLEEFASRIEKLLRYDIKPKAVLLSGGGNDIAGDEFGMLLNHAQAKTHGLNMAVVEGIIHQRVRDAYIEIINTVTHICVKRLGAPIPILLHGYDYPVPDGRGFLGGWGPLPGPWLDPGFRKKGYDDVQGQRVPLAKILIDNFNTMLKDVVDRSHLSHVRHIDLRNTLSIDLGDYKDWWANELHPTAKGFKEVTERFASVLKTLP